MLHDCNLHLLPTRRPLHFPGVTLPSKRELLTGRTAWVGSLQVRIPRTARVKIPLLDVDENFGGTLGFDFVGARRLWSGPSELEWYYVEVGASQPCLRRQGPRTEFFRWIRNPFSSVPRYQLEAARPQA